MEIILRMFAPLQCVFSKCNNAGASWVPHNAGIKRFFYHLHALKLNLQEWLPPPVKRHLRAQPQPHAEQMAEATKLYRLRCRRAFRLYSA